MPTTSNFGWTTPADTDLVKDGAAAIRTLGNGIDTSFLDLKGGTTGQVLSKNSNTDLDFTWVAQDDSNAIQNAIVDAKGDLISATAADTPARLAVGTNGQVLTADSTQSTGLAWTTISSGGMTLLSTTTLSGTTTTISSISGSYKSLIGYIYGINIASADYPEIKPNGSAATAWTGVVQGSPTLDQGNSQWWLTTGSAALRGTDTNNAFTFAIDNYASSTNYKPIRWNGFFLDNSQNNKAVIGGGGFRSNTAITSLDITSNGAVTYNGGTLLLYGMN